MKTYTIPLNIYNKPREITITMKRLGIKDYTYEFHDKEGCFEIGMSCDNEWERGHYGNRIYRKATAIDGWNTYISGDTTVIEQRRKIHEVQQRGYLCQLGKDDVEIKVHDYTEELDGKLPKQKEIFLKNNEDKLVRKFEGTYGSRPVLNFGETRTSHSAYDQFDDCFNVNSNTTFEEETKMSNGWEEIKKGHPNYNEYLQILNAPVYKKGKYDWQGVIDEVSSNGHAIRRNSVKLSPPPLLKMAGIVHRTRRSGEKFVTVFTKKVA